MKEIKPGSVRDFGPARKAWTEISQAEFATFQYEEPTPGFEKYWEGPIEIHVVFRVGRAYGRLHLEQMTESELDAFQAYWDHAFALARPIVQQRDREAQEKEANGDYAGERVYRTAGKFTVREGKKPAHGEGVPERSEPVPSVEGIVGRA